MQSRRKAGRIHPICSGTIPTLWHSWHTQFVASGFTGWNFGGILGHPLDPNTNPTTRWTFNRWPRVRNVDIAKKVAEFSFSFQTWHLVVSQNEGTQIYTPKYYSPHYGEPQNVTPNFGKPPFVCGFCKVGM